MKMNKLAAGALALALGLGAVAPAVAAEPKTGTNLVAEDYNEALALANKMYLKKKEATAAVEAAKARIKAAEAAVKAAKKAYDDAKDEEEAKSAIVEKAQAKLDAAQAKLDAANKELTDAGDDADKKAAAQAKVTAATAEKTEAQTYLDEVKAIKGRLEQLKKEVEFEQMNVAAKNDAVEAARKALAKAEGKEAKKAAQKKLDEASDALLAANKKYEEVFGRYAAAVKKAEADQDNIVVDSKLTEKQKASIELVKAQNELVEANGAYGVAVATEKAAMAKYSNGVDGALDKLKNAAKAAGAIVGIENDKVVVKPAIKDKDQFKKNNIEELKRAREEALTAIKAVKLLKELSPEKIKNVEAKLNALVAKNEALVKKADEKLAAAKVAFIATAYADEEADDTDALIKELDSTTSEIKELIKDKPEEEKKPEEKKPEEKKPEEKTPSKKAGNNARTGIAGVAGVAGILAAASVAYAASKRD
ncbi:hypothetical protein [uncultured Anaerococcus sp.]|uniref:hypothetical protein n=1 Tax=uncultured Anaerococcus sp. TaxID=293428 RepID=UPI002889D53C|nr:hypothetical protein [uncultured Anaerococcus sp.]